MERRIHDFLPYIKDFYTITDEGKIYSDNTGIMKTRNRAGSEYQIINFMTIDGKKKCFRLHRLVMMAFRPIEHPEEWEVNHIDGNKKNNNLSNLEWCTSHDNQVHAYKTGLQKSQKGKTKKLRRLNEEEVKKIIQLRAEGYSYNRIARKVNTSPSNVAKIVKGKTWSSIQFNDYSERK